ncbi:MAG: hypothetical protein HN509_07015 [Halobacteriovoraceae bacterium]|jgi:phage shock protein A|nr:hypothetical protein [Halobacteriovoraceae bacterium]MBT5095596.1 hypothetical protein [Halobacteriovoraceae bacterium]
MRIFSRLKTLWNGFWDTVLNTGEEKNTEALIHGTIRDYHERIRQLKQSKVNLLFHQRKLQDKKIEMEQVIVRYEGNLERCAVEGKDQLALQIIAKVETLKEEYAFVSEQLSKLTNEVGEAARIESELQRKIEHASHKLKALGSRIEALKLRKSLQAELANVSGSLKNLMPENTLQKLSDQALKLELEVEHIAEPRELENQIEEMEVEVVEIRHREALKQIKSRLDMAQLESAVVS